MRVRDKAALHEQSSLLAVVLASNQAAEATLAPSSSCRRPWLSLHLSPSPSRAVSLSPFLPRACTRVPNVRVLSFLLFLTQAKSRLKKGTVLLLPPDAVVKEAEGESKQALEALKAITYAHRSPSRLRDAASNA